MHDIYENRFIAVRTPAWHQLGTVFPELVLPSEAITLGKLDLGAEVRPLFIQLNNGMYANSGIVAVGRINGSEWEMYGTAAEFHVLPLQTIIPELDQLAEKFPLSAAGTLAKGAEVFFTFSVANGTEIAGEQYDEFIVLRHSYKPGVAQQVMWTPVRTVCRNTLIFGEQMSRAMFRVAHDQNVRQRTKAAILVTAALAQAETIKKRLEQLQATRLSPGAVNDVLERVYSVYVPKQPAIDDATDLVDAETINALMRPVEKSQKYAASLIEAAKSAYERLNDEFPNIAGTAYSLYQAVVETADWRRGRKTAAESAVVGARANEKARAWDLLTSYAER